jgi:hypothetical protein
MRKSVDSVSPRSLALRSPAPARNPAADVRLRPPVFPIVSLICPHSRPFELVRNRLRHGHLCTIRNSNPSIGNRRIRSPFRSAIILDIQGAIGKNCLCANDCARSRSAQSLLPRGRPQQFPIHRRNGKAGAPVIPAGRKAGARGPARVGAFFPVRGWAV